MTFVLLEIAWNFFDEGLWGNQRAHHRGDDESNGLPAAAIAWDKRRFTPSNFGQVVSSAIAIESRVDNRRGYRNENLPFKIDVLNWFCKFLCFSKRRRVTGSVP